MGESEATAAIMPQRKALTARGVGPSQGRPASCRPSQDWPGLKAEGSLEAALPDVTVKDRLQPHAVKGAGDN